jgi:hypothetical protein
MGSKGKPLSLAPLTPEDALRRAMSVPPPKHDPPTPKAKKAAKKKSGRKNK